MKNLLRLFISMLISVSMFINFAFAQMASSENEKPITLKHWMTPEEAKHSHLIGKDFRATDPPVGPIINFAEFDQVESVLIRYQFGISYQLIAAMSQKCGVTTIVASSAEQNYVTNQYQNQGVNLENCTFIIAPTNSYWTRDYGPWFIADKDDQMGIVDFIYNRPRPQDNMIPAKVAEVLGINLFAIDLKHCGGNYMTDGMGISASTNLVWNENQSFSHTQIDQIFLDYFGIHTYHVVPDPNNTYIDHIDCWGKYLAPDKILIRAVPPSHQQYNAIEATAAYFAAQTSSYGTPLQVIRVNTPNNQPYSNSLILNDQVFVPIMNSSYDAQAIATYQEAMPGYEVLGFTGSWQSTDALHCRTIGITNLKKVHIQHIPLLGEQPLQPEYVLQATIKAFSGEPLQSDSVLIYYRMNGQNWQTASMTNISEQLWEGSIPAGTPGSQVDYYLFAADETNQRIKHPFIGAPDPHTFIMGEEAYPHITVYPEQITATAVEGESTIESFTICNLGAAELYFNIETNTVMTEYFNFSLSDSPATNSYDYNTLVEMGWTTLPVEMEGKIAGVEISYSWTTDNWPEEGSFHIKSPAGTTAEIASGLPSGDYTFDLDVFNNEEIIGDWEVWIEDSYGDGGHQATNITLKFSIVICEINWLLPYIQSGIISPGQCVDLSVLMDASQLTPQLYHGEILIASNDPDNSLIPLPVDFEVTINAFYNTALEPDTLWFTDPNSIAIPQTAKFINASNVPITLEEIQMENYGHFAWEVSNISVSLPHQMQPNESVSFDVTLMVPILKSFANIQYDSVQITSSVGMDYLILACDIDIIPGVNDFLENRCHIYPNPFTEKMTIEFYNDINQEVKIEVIDIHGIVVAELYNGLLPFGNHSFKWTGINKSGVKAKAGIMFVRILSPEKTNIIKVLKQN
ncbi:MAG TPA: agmatine deiminase family protein [Bacteroidales bacterium]|nr:agmatine deiminase family protein [Bacteroidales bacterium]HQO07460.1 agmatine deiminase family protein [Bacteroidales bacterium]HQP53238.1 agmatine deiminase family protein [Bacteroidales bacterium]